jgi:hypothetical protein
MRAAGHAQPTQAASRIVTGDVSYSAESSADRRASCAAAPTAEVALPLAQVPAALSALLDFARWTRGPAVPWTGGPLHALRMERADALEAALLDAGVSYTSHAGRPATEREAAALWTRVARTLSREHAAEVARIEYTRVALGGVAKARARVWDARVSLVSALFEEIGGRS